MGTILAIYTLLFNIFSVHRLFFTPHTHLQKILREDPTRILYDKNHPSPSHSQHDTTRHNTQYHEHQHRRRTIQIPRQQSPNLRQPQRSHHLVHQSHRRGRNEPRLLQQPQCRSLKGQQPHTGLGRCRILHQSIQREGWSVV